VDIQSDMKENTHNQWIENQLGKNTHNT